MISERTPTIISRRGEHKAETCRFSVGFTRRPPYKSSDRCRWRGRHTPSRTSEISAARREAQRRALPRQKLLGRLPASARSFVLVRAVVFLFDRGGENGNA